VTTGTATAGDTPQTRSARESAGATGGGHALLPPGCDTLPKLLEDAIARRGDGSVVRDSAVLATDETLALTFATGAARVRVETLDP
jgi:hypothetical protein